MSWSKWNSMRKRRKPSMMTWSMSKSNLRGMLKSRPSSRKPMLSMKKTSPCTLSSKNRWLLLLHHLATLHHLHLLLQVLE